jgi:hypothetical protein
MIQAESYYSQMEYLLLSRRIDCTALASCLCSLGCDVGGASFSFQNVGHERIAQYSEVKGNC